MVPSCNSWDTHPNKFPNPNNLFYILADSKNSAQVIQVNENTLAV